MRTDPAWGRIDKAEAHAGELLEDRMEDALAEVQPKKYQALKSSNELGKRFIAVTEYWDRMS
jgi:hypothetical protein